MEYKLVIDDYASSVGSDNYHSIWGKSTKNVLDVRKAFIESYWRDVERGLKAFSVANLDKWDLVRAAEYREVAVASSREEMFLRAAAEGLV